MNGIDIQWGGFALVAVVVLLGSVLLTAFYSGGVRLLESGHSVAARGGAYLCFAVCVSAVLFGLWVVVPQFH